MLTPYPLEEPPLLPPFDGAWEGPDAPLLSGRRARVEGAAISLGAGLGLRARGAAAATEERCFLALDEPCFVWEGTGRGAVTLSAELLLPGSDIRVERSEDGSRLWLGSTETSTELLIGAIGGTLRVEEAAGAVRLEARGEDRLRLLVVGAQNEEDREQTLRAMARKGWSGLREQRQRHARQIDALAVRLHTPEPARDAAIGELAHRLDAELTRAESGRFTFADPLGVGAGLLALGVREPVRDVLRGPFDDLRMVELFALYAAWAGPDDFIRKHWPRVEEAVRMAASTDRSRLAASLLPVAEGLGLGNAVTALGHWLGEDGIDPLLSPPIPVAIQELCEVDPAALDGSVDLAPGLPRGWREMTLERLRIGPSTIDLKVLRRPAGLAVKVRLTHGPAVVVHLRPRLDFAPSGILIHDTQLPGPGLTLTLDGEAEAVWLT